MGSGPKGGGGTIVTFGAGGGLIGAGTGGMGTGICGAGAVGGGAFLNCAMAPEASAQPTSRTTKRKVNIRAPSFGQIVAADAILTPNCNRVKSASR